VKVLRILTRPNVGGPARQALALWHEHARNGVRTLLVVGQCEADEPALPLASEGIPPVELDALGPEAHGLLVLPAMRRKPNVIGDLQAAMQLRAVIARWQPDVVHTHMTKAGLLGRRAAWRERAPVVAHTFHGHVLRDYYGRVAARWLQSVERRLARRTDLLFAVSGSCRDELVELGVQPRGTLRVVPPAVDVARFEGGSRRAARQALGIHDDRVLLAFVGRLVPIKRVSRFVHTIGMLPEVEGFVLGDGPRRQRAQALSGSRMHFLGTVPDVERYLAAFDALLITSDREGCPLVAVEAFAAGVPVIGTDVPGVRDVLGPWGAGVLVPREQGAPGLAEAVRRLLADPRRREAIVAAARQGLGRFAPAAVARALADAYEETLRSGLARA
jgi:glycosyltransferase involved in cell wall biosynthesis